MRTPGNDGRAAAHHPVAGSDRFFPQNSDKSRQGRVRREGMRFEQIEQVLTVWLARPGTGACPGVVKKVIPLVLDLKGSGLDGSGDGRFGGMRMRTGELEFF